jgi:hypothetical protein
LHYQPLIALRTPLFFPVEPFENLNAPMLRAPLSNFCCASAENRLYERHHTMLAAYNYCVYPHLFFKTSHLLNKMKISSYFRLVI